MKMVCLVAYSLSPRPAPLRDVTDFQFKTRGDLGPLTTLDPDRSPDWIKQTRRPEPPLASSLTARMPASNAAEVAVATALTEVDLPQATSATLFGQACESPSR